MQISSARARIVAVLGPTNTGKTHLAMERMLGHHSGMIGFPLRLLARENYDRAVRLRGRNQVALITGEEKIVPAGARYFLCTVEAMPLDRPVAFLGVDEIQMCADPDRGHVFTDRLLHARGENETMFMGAETIKPLIRRLIPDIRFESRPRFSTLSYTGSRKITRLPSRSVMVAFSAADVYTIAELVRRHRGGAAVVLGALSPRTRNAQVAMYQAGEVDYLVATDAIGMGLNMDVNHVAFAQTRKFDGRVPRQLTPPELAQIAGRAGRHMNDGTFGTTNDIGPLDPEVIERIETHSFDALRTVFWRNSRLRYTSLAALQASLAQPPVAAGLVRARAADDELALAALAREPEVAGLADTPGAVGRLWDVCRIPDFGNVLTDGHTRLLARIYRYLIGPGGRLPTDWIAEHVKRVDRADGDIETLAQRIANIRTWTYVSFHGDWLEDAVGWQERTRAVEDRLSDALHDRLTQRFVDRRTAVLVRRMKDQADLTAAVSRKGDVLVEGHHVGRLTAFRFAADEDEGGNGRPHKAVTNAALKALRGEVDRRVTGLEAEADEAFSLAGTRILWRGDAVARLAKGRDPLSPAIDPLASDLLETAHRDRVRGRLETWMTARVSSELRPMLAARDAGLEGAARGLVFQLTEALGAVPRVQAEAQIAALSRDDRRALRRLGVRIGRTSVFFPGLLRPSAIALRAVLWTAHEGLTTAPAAVAGNRQSLPAGEDVPDRFYDAVGYRRFRKLAVRIDALERLAARAWSLSAKGPFAISPDVAALLDCDAEEMGEVLAGIGFRARQMDEQLRYAPSRKQRPRRPSTSKPHGRRTRTAEPSPFAKLRDLAKPQ